MFEQKYEKHHNFSSENCLINSLFGLFCSANSNSISLENPEGGWVWREEMEIQTWENSGILPC